MLPEQLQIVVFLKWNTTTITHQIHRFIFNHFLILVIMYKSKRLRLI